MFYSRYNNKDLLQHLSKSPYPVAQYNKFAMALDSQGTQYIFHDVSAFDLQTKLLKLSGTDSALLPTKDHWLSVIVKSGHASAQLLCSTCDDNTVRSIDIWSKSYDDGSLITTMLSAYHGEQAEITFHSAPEVDDSFYSRKFFLNAEQAQKLYNSISEQKELYEKGKFLYAALDGILNTHGKNCLTFSDEVYKIAGFHGSIADYWLQSDTNYHLSKSYPTAILLYAMKSSSWISSIEDLIPSIAKILYRVVISHFNGNNDQLEDSVHTCNDIKESLGFTDMLLSCQNHQHMLNHNNTVSQCLCNDGEEYILEPYDSDNMYIDLENYQCIIPTELFDHCLV